MDSTAGRTGRKATISSGVPLDGRRACRQPRQGAGWEFDRRELWSGPGGGSHRYDSLR